MVENTTLDKDSRIENWGSYFFGVIVILISMILIMGIVINRKAIDPEALTNFYYMQELNLVDIWTGETFPGHFVTYRPVMATLLRWEYRIFDFNPPAYFAVNQVLLAVVALFLYDILHRKTGETLPALLGTLFFLTDWQIIQTLYVIGEVQITLAGIFGLWAIWLLWFGKRNGRFKPAIIFLLLLAAALSKEFGLAFSLVIFIDALYRRENNWKTYLITSVSVIIVFFALRMMIIPESSLGREYSTLKNMIYWYSMNIGSGFVFSFVNLYRPISDGELPSLGSLNFPTLEASSMVLLQIIPIILLFLLGFKSKNDRRATIPFLFLLLGNSLLFFYNYAFRFHFLGKIGLYAVVAFGINFLYKKWTTNPIIWRTLLVTFMYLAAMLFWRGDQFHEQLLAVRDWTENKRLCIPTTEYYQQEDYIGYYTITNSDIVRMVMEYYDMPREYCNCLNPNPLCKR